MSRARPTGGVVVEGVPTLLVDLGLEGGGLSIYGRRVGGVWAFWSGGSSLDLDENDDEVIRTWTTAEVDDLRLVVPPDWPLFLPSAVHPEAVDWLREHYETSVASLPDPERRMQSRGSHGDWASALSLGDRR